MTMNPRTPLTRAHRPLHRRGSAYLFVLGAAMLIATAGVLATTFQSSRLARQQSLNTTSVVDAEHAAAMEYALEMLRQDPAGNVWRTTRQLVAETDAMLETPKVTHTIMLTDPVSGDLRTAKLDTPAQLTVRTVAGAAVRESSVTLNFDVAPLAALNNALIREQRLGSGVLMVTGPTGIAASRLLPDATFRSNAELSVRAIEFLDQAEAINGNVALTVPSPSSDLFAYYMSIGTVINLTNGTTFDKVLFSPSSNPANTGLNPRGVYVINANNNRLTISNSRVVGTLVILDANSASEIGPKVSMTPASSDMPTLLVRGNIEIQLQDADLTESDAERNLNPTGAPYLGATDSDQSDSYPSRIRGLVYVSNSLSIDENSAFEGVLWVGSKLTIANGRQATVRWTPLTNPIAGFSQVTGVFTADGSMTRVAR